MNYQNEHHESLPMMEINTTPLIDVMLVLLVMVIITIPAHLHKTTMSLSNGLPEKPVATKVLTTAIKINIMADGGLLWNGKRINGKYELEAKIAQIIQIPNHGNKRTLPEIQVLPDRKVAYKYVAIVLAIAERLGIKKLVVLGNERFGE